MVKERTFSQELATLGGSLVVLGIVFAVVDGQVNWLFIHGDWSAAVNYQRDQVEEKITKLFIGDEVN